MVQIRGRRRCFPGVSRRIFCVWISCFPLWFLLQMMMSEAKNPFIKSNVHSGVYRTYAHAIRVWCCRPVHTGTVYG